MNVKSSDFIFNLSSWWQAILRCGKWPSMSTIALIRINLLDEAKIFLEVLKIDCCTNDDSNVANFMVTYCSQNTPDTGHFLHRMANIADLASDSPMAANFATSKVYLEYKLCLRIEDIFIKTYCTTSILKALVFSLRSLQRQRCIMLCYHLLCPPLLQQCY